MKTQEEIDMVEEWMRDVHFSPGFKDGEIPADTEEVDD